MNSSLEREVPAAGFSVSLRRMRDELRSRLRVVPAWPFGVAALAVAIVTQYGLTQFPDTVPRTHYGFVVAIALLAVGASATWARSTPATQTDAATVDPGPITLPFRWEVALVGAVFALAAFFRFWRLLSFPAGLWYDEGVNANDAIILLEKDHTRIWFDTVFGRSTLYLYLLAGSFKLFGFGIFAIRIVPAVAGLLAVIAFYFLARRLLGPVPAIVATALFAVSRWAVTFSRVSWEASVQPLFEVLAVYFLIRGLDTKSRWSFALGGAALAGGLYTYIAFRVVPVFVAFLLVYVAITQFRAIRQNIAGLAIYALAFLIVIAPLANFAVHNQDRVTERTRQVNVFKEVDRAGNYDPLQRNIEKSIRMLNVRGDGNGRHNLPGRPMVDEITAALVVLGIAVSAWSLRNWRRGSIAPWLILSLIPGALTLEIENPSAIRGIGALPSIFLLAGLAVSSVYRSMPSTRFGQAMFTGIATALVIGSVAINYYDIFEKQASDARVYEGFTPEFTQVAKVVADRADEDRTFVTHQYYGHHAVSTLAHEREYSPYDAGYQLVFPRDPRDVLLIMDVYQFQMLPTLRRLYPNITTEDYVDPYDRVFFTRATIPAADIDASHNIPATVTSAGRTETRTMPLDYVWTLDDLNDGPVDVTFDGYMWATYLIDQPSQDLSFTTQNFPGSGLAIEVDGQPLTINADGTTSAVPFRIGEHAVHISARIERPGPLQLSAVIGRQATRPAADWLYGTVLVDHGFQVAYRGGRDFSTDPVLITQVPFAVPMPFLPGAPVVEYVGMFNASVQGTYEFALDGATSAQLYVDDELVVDNGGSHGRQRRDGSIPLTRGLHRIAIQYVFVSLTDWQLSVLEPGTAWHIIDGSEIRLPTGPYRRPTVVNLGPDDGPFGQQGQTYDGMLEAYGIAVTAGGQIVVGGGDSVVFIGPDAKAAKTVKLDVTSITDLDVMSGERIVVLDSSTRSLLILSSSGDLISRIDGAFASAVGLDVKDDVAYVASPAGGVLYRVALPDGPVESMQMADVASPVRAAQPSDIAVADDGTIYVTDFEKQTIVRSVDGGATATEPFRGVNGTGVQLPRIATIGKLIFVSEPTGDRIVVYDKGGRQRGVYIFPARAGGTRPMGLVATPDGYLYVAGQTGAVLRLKWAVPPDTQAQLDLIP